MLGVLRAALPGAAFAQSSGTLVSLWAFDETSGAGGVFDDLGPAALPMSIVGSWPDLTTDSIVQGVGGTSAYTDGSAYATIPADQAAHALNALTLSFYYERGSAAAKQILLAAGDGTQPGDFSIEVLAERQAARLPCRPGRACSGSSGMGPASPAPICRSARRIGSTSASGRRVRESISTARS